MKKFTLILSLLFLTGFTQAKTIIFQYPPNHYYRMAQDIVKAVKTRNFQLLNKWTLNDRDKKEILANKYYSIKLRKLLIKSLIKSKRKMKRRFRSFISYIKKNKINVKKIKIITISFAEPKLAKAMFNKQTDPRRYKPFIGADIYIILRFQKQLYKMVLDDCIKLPGRWIITDRLKWFGKIE